MAGMHPESALERIRIEGNCWAIDSWACSARPEGHADIVVDVIRNGLGDTTYLYGCSYIGQIAMPCKRCKMQADVSKCFCLTHAICYVFLFPLSLCWNMSAAKRRTDLITLDAVKKLFSLQGEAIPLINESAGSVIIPDGIKMSVVDWYDGQWKRISIKSIPASTTVMPINFRVQVMNKFVQPHK